MSTSSSTSCYLSLWNYGVDFVTTGHCNDENIIKAYSLVMKQGLDLTKNFQLLLLGAEYTGKTSLVSSFLGEKFVEEQLSTKGADVGVCTIFCQDWMRISHSDKSAILHNQFSEQYKDIILTKIANFPIISLPQPSS